MECGMRIRCKNSEKVIANTLPADAACGKKLIAACFLRQSEDDGNKRLPPIPSPRPPGTIAFGEITDNRLIVRTTSKDREKPCRDPRRISTHHFLIIPSTPGRLSRGDNQRLLRLPQLFQSAGGHAEMLFRASAALRGRFSPS